MSEANGAPKPFKAAIIQDFSTTKPWGPMTIDATTGYIRRGISHAKVDHYRAADGEALPPATDYDLFVLTGGTVNLLEDEKPEWAIRVLDLIREVSVLPNTKIVAFCWGHQAVHYALGGSLGVLAEGPRIAVEEMNFTTEGKEFFGKDTLLLQKYHKRYVTALAPGFTALAERCEISSSVEKGFITFQGHPDLSRETVKILVETDDGLYKQNETTARSPCGKLFSSDTADDGGEVWLKIMDFVRK
ncbi:glutamine amidotransferase class-i family protein [Colletotrichum karsti]|uniref:Glutamine amidotransferase class-i family protein n=1 Tax=Colletotrichum karsti TaxID=1095194 RepID=A0A9P6ID56_9PEZI|nr:glutamine amidotransferase class-i family protein [Colletotrichum karsti]KAF9880445.1 glutamine amidotransferase class-i family protein [Colletotrichum karsti]